MIGRTEPVRLRLDRLPRAIAFDWDNTLVTNKGCILAALNAALAAFGRSPWTMQDMQSRISKSLRDTFPSLFGPDWPGAERLFYEHFSKNHLQGLEPLPGAADLLVELSARGIPLIVVSNKRGPFLRAEAGYLGWSGFFKALVGASDACADKPDPAPLSMGLGQGSLECGPGCAMLPGDDVWFIGDADVDMQIAHAAGCVGIRVGDTPHAPGAFAAAPPCVHLEGCAAISSLVKQIARTI
jgi:phosphoglycolate phosphatase